MSNTELFETYIEQSTNTIESYVSHGDGHNDGHTDSTNGTVYQDQHTDYHADRENARS